MAPKIKLEGRSGCLIKIFSSDGCSVVRKTSKSISYNERLISQFAKQKDFENQLSKNGLISPKIFASGIEKDTGLFYFDMEYINGDKFSDYFVYASLTEINCFRDIFLNYLNQKLEDSIWQEPPIELISNKIQDLIQILETDAIFGHQFIRKTIKYLQTNVPQCQIPICKCHGDLTFSNMIFQFGPKINVFDFLDSFIESPVIDLVKLRQDTRFNWSVEIDQNLQSYKKTKVLQIMNYLDRSFEANFLNQNSQIREWYDYLELFNLIRIMPYANNIKDVQFLKININKLIKA